MPFQIRDNLHYFTFESFAGLKIKHGVFTRRGGVSPAPWDSLNVGGTVGDARSRVIQNRLLTLQALGISIDAVYDSWQVHGNRIEVVEGPRRSVDPLVQADGLLSADSGTALMMRFADCVPVFLVDPERKIVGLVHAGWKGTVLQVVWTAVDQMVARFGTDPRRVVAGIGPSIGPDHYEVGSDVVEQARSAFGEQLEGIIQDRDGHSYFDLWQANRSQLLAAGVGSVEVAGICTACDLEHWYSHRAEGGQTGRFAAIIQWEA